MLNAVDLEVRKDLHELGLENVIFAKIDGFEGIYQVDFPKNTYDYFIGMNGGIVMFNQRVNAFHIEKIIPRDLYLKRNAIKAKNNDIKNTKGENEEMTYSIEKTLKNGVNKYSLNIDNDFNEAQSMLDHNETTSDIDAYSAYNERVDNDFVGTYSVKVDRKSDYDRFIRMLDGDVYRKKQEHRKDVDVEGFEERRKKIYAEYESLDADGRFEKRKFYQEELNKISVEEDKARDASWCECDACNFRRPRYEEWKTGKYYKTEKSVIKLGKLLGKNKYGQEIVDFYSTQVKTEREVFLTISDRVQHIAGMSFYSPMDWDGMNGSSCQDPKNGGEYCLTLGGALHDDKLFTAMLHYSHDDIEDMEEKLRARVLMRYMTIDGEACLLPTVYYGNNETKSLLHCAMEQLHEMDIYDKSILDGRDRVCEDANGGFEMMVTDEIYIEREYEEERTVDCPACDGSGKMEVYSDKWDRYVNVDCPACDGSGEVETTVMVYIDEYVTVEDEMSVKPYVEAYTHSGHSVTMYIDKDKLDDIRGDHGNDVDVVSVDGVSVSA